MIRNTLCLLTMLFAMLTASAGIGSDWYKYTVYNDCIDDVVETSSKVYYLSGGSLFSFSPDDNESYAYNHLNKINDIGIKSIHYNAEKKYLLVVYDDSNLDVIFDSGKVINMPDIKDSSVASSKAINDVAFGNDRIAIATDFGIVVYDDKKFEVIESGLYYKVINNVAIMDGNLLIYGHYATGFKIVFAPLEIRHNTLDKFQDLFGFAIESMMPLADDVLAFRENLTHKLYVRRVNFQTKAYANIVPGEYIYDFPVRKYKDGFYSRTADKLLLVSPSGVTTRDLPEPLQQQRVTFYSTPDQVWAGDADGISCYDISSGAPTVLYDKMLYRGYSTVSRVGLMKWSADNKRLYVSNLEASINRSFAKGERSPHYQTTNMVSGLNIDDVSLKDASAHHSYAIEFGKKFGNARMYGDPQSVVEDPDDPTKYYCASYYEGIYVIKRNPATGVYEEIGKFNAANSPLNDERGPRPMYLDFDRDGNLWVGHQFGSNISMLPAQKRRQDPASITLSDWISHPKINDVNYQNKDFTGLICKKSNMVFYSMSLYQSGFRVIDTKGTYDNFNDDVLYSWPRVTDQDGKEVTYTYITFFLEDNRGCVWVGTNAGIFEITNPSEATSHNMRVRRIKVPRNDGTNYADYLLESEFINWIALDPAGRKWVATENSGIYLVSETGDKILAHLDSESSPLQSNLVTSIECDRSDNTVYVGTLDGLYSFKSDASTPEDDYSEILAYPNPVRPEYSGIVTITGLMDNSVVKITDSVGNVVYETRSQGGMATWDTTGVSGSRVSSGVYYVYASRSDANTSTGAVTKILVIN